MLQLENRKKKRLIYKLHLTHPSMPDFGKVRRGQLHANACMPSTASAECRAVGPQTDRNLQTNLINDANDHS